jgi:hypothetical protein
MEWNWLDYLTYKIITIHLFSVNPGQVVILADGYSSGAYGYQEGDVVTLRCTADVGTVDAGEFVRSQFDSITHIFLQAVYWHWLIDWVSEWVSEWVIKHLFIHFLQCSWRLADLLACSQKVSHPEIILVSAAIGASFPFPLFEDFGACWFSMCFHNVVINAQRLQDLFSACWMF